MRARTSASQAKGSTSLSLAVLISVAMAAARSRPSIGAGEEPCLATKGKSSQGPLRRIVREADPAIVEEADEALPASQHVVDRLSDGGRARQALAFPMEPGLQVGHERRALFLPDLQSRGRVLAVDGTLDRE